MYKYESLDALFKAFQNKEITLSDVHTELDAFIRVFERQKADLVKKKIIAKDKELWEKDIRPQLELTCETMIYCGQEAKAFIDSQDQKHLAIIQHLVQKNRILLSKVKQLAGLTSTETQAMIKDEIASIKGDSNQVQNYLSTEIAPVEVSFGD